MERNKRGSYRKDKLKGEDEQEKRVGDQISWQRR